MNVSRIYRLLTLAACGWLGLTVAWADIPELRTEPLVPGPDDGPIAFVTAQWLQQQHYLRQDLDDTVSSNLLDRYVETLDPQRLHFLESDLAEFERHRFRLDDMILDGGKDADVSPGFEIFERFLKRLRQRVDYATNLLNDGEFRFDKEERILLNRRDASFPQNIDEARRLWRDRLRFEYLEEKLSRKKDKTEAEEEAGEEKRDEKTPSEASDVDAEPAPAKTDAEEIIDILTRRYKRTLRLFSEWDSDDVTQLYLTALARTYDPHSDYMGRAQLENFAMTMNLSLFGIGAELYSEDGYCTIRRLLPGGPAIKSKQLKAKDRIVEVAQGDETPVDVVDMSLQKIVQMIRGPKGTEVCLTIIPASAADSSEREVVSLIRDEIKLEEQAAKARLIEMPGDNGTTNRIGVIDLPSFYASLRLMNARGKPTRRSTTYDVARLIRKLKKEQVEGLVLDLRHNGGGSLEEAVELTGLFIKEGPVVQVRNPDGKVFVDVDTDPGVLYEGPLVVLVSRASASASEILAGALQDYGRAVIVGDASTHGKGTVQSLNQLLPSVRRYLSDPANNPGAVKLTIRKFYRANGESTQQRGVIPDIVLPSVANHLEDVGEKALKNPLPWDTIKPADYETVAMVDPHLAELRRCSDERVAASTEFDYIREDIAHYQKLQEDKTVSLHEATRLQEREEAKARQEARDAERKNRAPSNITVYEITLKEVDLPGLPAPVGSTNEVSVDIEDSDDPATAKADPDEDPNTEEDEDESLAVDATLDEAQLILLDYIALLAHSEVIAAGSQTETGSKVLSN